MISLHDHAPPATPSTSALATTQPPLVHFPWLRQLLQPRTLATALLFLFRVKLLRRIVTPLSQLYNPSHLIAWLSMLWATHCL